MKTKSRNNAIIKRFALLTDLDYSEMAEALGVKESSFRNKISSGNFNLDELIKLTSLREASIAIIKDDRILFDFHDEKLN